MGNGQDKGEPGYLLLTRKNWDRKLQATDRMQTWGSDTQVFNSVHSLEQHRLPFLGLLWFFHILVPGEQRGFFGSWIGFRIIFRNKFQQTHVMLMERAKKINLLRESGPGHSQASD
jgi:hypothetical protein